MIERPPGDLWVFAYGSLMWQPEIAVAESQPVTVHGYHRALCLYSFEYRGTPECPGLVFGLDRGGACRGFALRVTEENADTTIETLWKREMFLGVYQPRWLKATLTDGRRIKLLSFVAERNHTQYIGRLDDKDLVKFMLQGQGSRGHCLDYVKNTLDHLHAMGIRERALTRLIQKAEQVYAEQGQKT